MTWSFDDKLPIYLQIIRILKSDLARGKYQPGEKLPAVRELALSAGVNPNTMQKALAELERDGLLKSQRTSGRFVTDDKEKIMEVRTTLAYDEIARMVDTISSLGYHRGTSPSCWNGFFPPNRVPRCPNKKRENFPGNSKLSSDAFWEHGPEPSSNSIVF